MTSARFRYACAATATFLFGILALSTACDAGSKLASNENSNADLVCVTDIAPDIVVELKYATDDNFTKRKVYPVDLCVLRRATAEKLKRASELVAKKGYRIKVWDAYRPLSVQRIFWSLVPDPRYVADPAKGSKHNRGTAVDVTLVDALGREVVMPTGFDDFTERASRKYRGTGKAARQNAEYLGNVMKRCGFDEFRTEWWHFDDNDWKKYPLLDVPLESIQERRPGGVSRPPNP